MNQHLDDIIIMIDNDILVFFSTPNILVETANDIMNLPVHIINMTGYSMWNPNKNTMLEIFKKLIKYILKEWPLLQRTASNRTTM